MRNDMPSWIQRLAVQALLAAGLVCGSAAQAQSEASAALSLMPVASVVVASGAASATAGAVVALPVALSVGGAVLTVKAVQASATGTVIVLERASDGAQASIELTGRAASATAYGVGTVDALAGAGGHHQVAFSLAVEFVDAHPQRMIAPGQQLITQGLAATGH